MATKLYGIDLDGICFDFIGAFCEWLHDKVGVKIPEKEEITSYYWYETMDDLDKKTFLKEFDKFGLAGGYRNLALLPGAREGLDEIIAAGNKIVYITNRPNYALEDTRAALEEHDFPSRYDLFFANGSKSPVINAHGVDVFIDDSPRTIAEISENTEASIYCMDYPFNRHLPAGNYTRVSSWEEFLIEEGIGARV
jgi:uncharacterized HAD superfamily protein